MTQVYLARHGETEWNAGGRVQGQTNSNLSELGKKQATRLTEHLSKVPLRAIYVSDLTRAMDTAAPIAAAHGLEVNVRPGLREICYGEWEGRTMDEIKVQYPDLWHRYHKQRERDVAIPGSETWGAVQARAVAVFEEALAAYPGIDDTVILVAHGGSLRTLVLHALNSQFTVAPLMLVRWNNCGLTRLDCRDGVSQLVFHNDTHHLEGLS